jgi:hypothetical protein
MREFLDELKRKQRKEGLSEERAREEAKKKEKKLRSDNHYLFNRQCQLNNYEFLPTGWPDRLVRFEGKIIGVEIKNPWGRITPNQKEMIDWLEEAGIKCFIFKGEVDFWQRVEERLKEVS